MQHQKIFQNRGLRFTKRKRHTVKIPCGVISSKPIYRRRSGSPWIVSRLYPQTTVFICTNSGGVNVSSPRLPKLFSGVPEIELLMCQPMTRPCFKHFVIFPFQVRVNAQLREISKLVAMRTVGVIVIPAVDFLFVASTQLALSISRLERRFVEIIGNVRRRSPRARNLLLLAVISPRVSP